MRHQNKTLTSIDGIAHGFFTRKDGVSEGIYASLNCGPGSNDDAEAVKENRRRVMEELEAYEASLCSLHQIHSDKVVAVRAPWSDASRPQADAMVSKTPNMALGILTADCGPVLFADAQAGVIGAAHAGWKGASAGVLENTVDAMEAFGAHKENMVAVIGPTIAQENYEVGPEFVETLVALSPENTAFFIPSDKPNHQRFDLPAYITHRLAQCGLRQIENLAMDTYRNEAEFFSYRRTTHRGEPDYGRQLSAIMIRE